MSLAQHVSSLEGVDRDTEPDELDHFPPIRRMISYDVLQPPTSHVPVADQRLGTPAYKHSTGKRIGMRLFYSIDAHGADLLQLRWWPLSSPAGSRPELYLVLPH